MYVSRGKEKRKPVKNRRATPAPHRPSNKTVAKYEGLVEDNPGFTPGTQRRRSTSFAEQRRTINRQLKPGG